jgi:hypothetical protein
MRLRFQGRIRKQMNRKNARFRYAASLLLLLFAGATSSALAQGTAFSYQGRLQDSGANANGTYDFQFTLWDSLSGGTQQPQPSPVTVMKTNVPVANGVFTLQLDFGASGFPGADRFLEIGARPSGGGSFTLLTPRQQITSTPYAIRTLGATTADGLSNACVACVPDSQIGSVGGSKVNGAIPVASVPGGSGNYIQNTTAQQAASNFNISGNGTADIIVARTQYNIKNNNFRVLGTSGCQAPCGAPYSNTFVGVFAGESTAPTDTSGYSNSFFGNFAGYLNTTGQRNSIFGFSAGSNNTSGSGNSYFGELTGQLANGSFNSYFGTEAATSSGAGSYNAAFGASAGRSITSGSDNTFVGYNSGVSNTTENLNTLIGFYSDTTAGITNATAVGAYAKVAESNALVLGAINGINFATMNTAVGIGTTRPLTSLHVVGDSSFVGNVGIGTTAPGGPLTVVQATNGAGLVATVNGSNTLTGTNTQFTSFFHVGDTITVSGATARTITSIASDTLLTVSAAFLTSANNLTYTLTGGTLMVVKSNGNVGIGTTAPIQRLHVVGNGLFTGNLGIGATSPAVALEVQRNSTVASDWQTGQLRISGASDPNMQLSLGYDTSSNLGVIQAGQAFTGFKNLALNPFDGNVGIGTNSPQSKLHVNGVIRMDALGSPAGIFPLCWNANDQIASCTSSSLRYKTAVRSFTGGLQIINHLRPISFTWRDGGMHDVGLAAEEVEKVEPLLAYRNKKGEVEGVRYNQLSAVFINAFKEQQAQIQQQQEQLKRQQEHIKRQEDQARQQRAAFAAQQQQLDALKKLVCRSHSRAIVCR